MGCSGCQKKSIITPMFQNIPESKPKENKGVIKNLQEAASKQPNKFKWFRDGITGIIKCFTNALYSDEDIILNREVCKNCEFSTKNADGKLTIQSQCMRPDPNNNNAPCGCFLTCKTQSGNCDKWVHLSISTQKPKKIQTLRDSDDEVEL